MANAVALPTQNALGFSFIGVFLSDLWPMAYKGPSPGGADGRRMEGMDLTTKISLLRALAWMPLLIFLPLVLATLLGVPRRGEGKRGSGSPDPRA